jgi:hypothetical protein
MVRVVVAQVILLLQVSPLLPIQLLEAPVVQVEPTEQAEQPEPLVCLQYLAAHQAQVEQQVVV